MFVVYLIIFLILLKLLYSRVLRLYRKHNWKFNNEIVLITGAGSGLGKALSYEFAKEKCNVICVDVDEQNNAITVEEVKQLLKGTNCKTVGYTCDISDREQIVQLAQKVLSEFGHVDILVNNAGIANTGYILDFPPELLKKTFDINLMSHFWTIQEFLPQMLKRNKGYIIGIASIVSFQGVPEVIPYCTSKFAVLGLMQALRSELHQMNSEVKTLSIHPAFMSSNMLRKAFNEKNHARWFYIKKPDYFARGVINALKEGRSLIVLPEYFALFLILYQLTSMFIKKHVLHKMFTANAFINPKLKVPKKKTNVD